MQDLYSKYFKLKNLMCKPESTLQTLKNSKTDFGYLMFYLTIK